MESKKHIFWCVVLAAFGICLILVVVKWSMPDIKDYESFNCFHLRTLNFVMQREMGDRKEYKDWNWKERDRNYLAPLLPVFVKELNKCRELQLYFGHEFDMMDAEILAASISAYLQVSIGYIFPEVQLERDPSTLINL